MWKISAKRLGFLLAMEMALSSVLISPAAASEVVRESEAFVSISDDPAEVLPAEKSHADGDSVNLRAASNENEFDISDGSITITAASDGYRIEQNGVASTVNYPSVPVIYGNSAGGTLTIAAESGLEAHVILRDLTIDASASESPAAAANCKVHIELQGNNTLKGGKYKAGLEHADCNENEILKISGGGSLNVEGGASYYSDSYGPAGIGGSLDREGSYIEINGGTITSKGGNGGAGIGGGGSGGKAGTHITINDGNVTAIGGTGAAGIGGGEGGEGSDITINGGIVTAKGGCLGAGIGGGFTRTGKGSNIRITGGIVMAAGGSKGAGIGGGLYSDGSKITIEGGTVIAAGGSGAAGIGGGNGDDEGDCQFGTGSDITISGSCMVKVSGGARYEEYLITSGTGAAIGNGGGSTKDGEEVLPDITGLQGGSVIYYPRGTGISEMEADSVTPLGSPHTVSFNANSGNDSVTVSPEKKIVFYGESDESIYGELPSPTREGYKFIGWFTERTGGTEIKKEMKVVSDDDQTLYARWARYEEYTITYNNDDGTVSKTQKYPTLNSGNDKLERSPGFREGYTFEGWKVIDASGNWEDGKVYGSRMSLDGMYGDITVSGQWSAIRYKIHFEPNGGSGRMDEQDREYGDGKELPGNQFTYDGHKFIGWSNLDSDSIVHYPSFARFYPDKSKENVFNSSTTTTLYALWEYNVTFDTDGGTDIGDLKYYILDDSTLPAAERKGYFFRGWKAGEVNGNWVDGRIYDAGTALKGRYGDTKLTALWEAVPEPFSIITSSLPEGKEGEPFNAVLETDGRSSGKVTWSIDAGSLPEGLSLNSGSDNTGIISGTPEESGEFAFTAAASADNGVVSKDFKLFIAKKDVNQRPESANRIAKSIDLSGLDLKTNENTVVTLLGPSKPVTYNGRTHVWAGESLSRKQLKHKCADLDIAAEGLPGSVSSDFCYKGTESSSEGRACFYIKLRADKTSAYYKALSRDEKKKLRKAIKKANKILKKKENRLYFSIEKMDLNDFIFDNAESRGNHYVFKRKNGNGDTLIMRRRRIKHVSPDGFEISYRYENSLTAYFSGVRCALPKSEFRRTVSGGTVSITGKNKSITGSMSGKTE